MGNEEVDLVTVAKPSEKKSLLERYDIPVENLSYDYISQCTNSKELERIVLILRSGEEGVYPDLTRHAVERLVEIKPTSKVLRVEEPILTREMLEPEERKEIDDGMDKWMIEMQNREKDLEEGKALQLNESISHPEIRQIKEEPSKKTTQSAQKRQKNRLASCDYAGWDKYDADTELDRMDLHDEQNQIEAKRVQQEQREEEEKSKKISREAIVNKLSLTATELGVMAEQEKDRGNEAFKAGDYEEALLRYNSSIAMDATVSSYNNRAITYIKLRRYEDAVSDCNRVLSMEHTNIKALLRRGLALENLEKKSQALADYESVLKLEPNYKIAITAVNRLRKPSDSKKVRMKIQEESADDEKAVAVVQDKTMSHTSTHTDSDYKSDEIRNKPCEICFCDRAPGSSQNPRPLPHIKSSYCFSPTPSASVKKNSNALNLTKQQSIFTDVKMPAPVAKPSKVIIEELPSEPISSKPINEEANVKEASVAKDEKSEGNWKSIDSTKKIKEVGKGEETTERKHTKERHNNKQSENHSQKEKPSSIKPTMRDSFSPKKIEVASKYEKPVSRAEREVIIDLDTIETPYEFLRVWQSLKADSDLSLHARLLRSLAPEDFDIVIGNKLDGGMFSVMLRCLEQHFCTPQDAQLVCRFLTSFSQLCRFSIVSMFMDVTDKKVLKKLFTFLEEQGSPAVPTLRQAYNF